MRYIFYYLYQCVTWYDHMALSTSFWKRYFLTEDVNWCCHHPCRVTNEYCKDQNLLLLTSAEIGKWLHHSTSFVKATFFWKFHVDTSSRTKYIIRSIFSSINTLLLTPRRNTPVKLFDDLSSLKIILKIIVMSRER